MKNLVIVESPAKAKTIEKYLGKDFRVLSSIGHIRSIAKKTKTGTPPIDVKNGFETVYEIDPDKKKTIAELKKAVKDADTVWLATDEDREGEAIAWHLCEVLKLDPKATKRIVFHEITKGAIEAAVKNPRTVDMNLVRAQQARQILDRIVGFELSPVVWQKVPGGKSAGRVQSPAVRLLVEREREIDAFASSFQFKVIAELESRVTSHESRVIKAELPQKFDTEEEARAFLESLIGATFTVSDITTTPGTRNPGAPFTTSTLQQEANSKLGFGSRATMASAQKLYQDGKITYMRTDSVNLSGQAIAAAKDYIVSAFGPEYSLGRTFKTKSASAQEAHEAIRPTDMKLEKASSSEYDQKLYTLIRNRTLASQMSPAKLEKTTVTIKITKSHESRVTSHEEAHVFEARGEVIVFDGFLKVYGASKKDPDILPPLSSGDMLDLNVATARQTFARPPARYTEGSLVKKLEELGIGRPSTYATIINTVQERGYAIRGENEGEPRDVVVLSYSPKQSQDEPQDAPTGHSDTASQNTLQPETDQAPGPLSGLARSRSDGAVSESTGPIIREIIQEKTGSDRGKLVPTATGQVIADFLTEHFEQVVDYGFTASVEEHFDDIARNKLERNKMLQDFYTPFHSLIEQSGGIDRSTVAQARTIGTDPKSGKLISARFSRFGPVLQLGDTDDKENKPQFAPLPAGSKIETVTLEQALKAFELPRVVGETKDGEVIKANIGRFGPYIQVGKLFVSIKPLDPHDITLSQALELYDAKLKAEAEKNIADFGDGIKVLNGRFGPYVTDGSKNAKIPKDTDPKTITHDQAKQMIADAPAAKKRFTRRKKS
ncbi:type I DNA topoisomerase [Candidatus Saccharibacteria bacterium]|nr:MAG: type I DNA topoisomerase [Candidatus Saccharibacteria bacterium]